MFNHYLLSLESNDRIRKLRQEAETHRLAKLAHTPQPVLGQANTIAKTGLRVVLAAMRGNAA